MKQVKPIKDKWLGARVDPAMDDRVSAYIAASEDPDMNMGILVRRAVIEYMENHPVRDPSAPPKTDPLTVTDPGE